MIVAAILARNEAGPDRYLARVISNCKSLCDMVLVVDDGSTDDTAGVAEAAGAEIVRYRPTSSATAGFWGNDEAPIREFLWREAAKRAGPDGWIYIADADHEMLGISREDFATLCTSTTCNSWAFPLWDCWDSDRQMRVDGFWRAHFHPRPWLLKALPHKDFQPRWQRQGLHVGHIPHNYPLKVGVAPGLAGICHLGYVQAAHRVDKHQRYTAVPTLSDFERAHAESILDPHPQLEPIPVAATNRILIGTVVRKPPAVIEALLKSLRWQQFRAETTVDILAVANFAPQDSFKDASMQLLEEAERAGHITLQVVEAPLGDYGDGPQTRQWTAPAYSRIAQLKDEIMRNAVQAGYTHCWLIDADVLCDPHTLQALLDADAPVVSAVYWTQWQLPQEGLSSFVHAGPQVWQRGSYDMAGWLTAEEFRKRLIERRRLQVAGLGACTLLRTDAIRKGLSFSFFREKPMGAGGMAEGEDRHFCARAAALHVPLYADAWSDVYHAYHPAEYGDIPAVLQELEQWPHPDTPTLGALVSLVVEIVDPLVAGDGRMHATQRRFVRGRLGSLPVLPQIEDAVAGMVRGEARLLRVHFPLHHKVVELRGKTKVMRVVLLDCKDFRYAPVVERELFQSARTGRHLDMTAMSTDQVASMEATPDE